MCLYVWFGAVLVLVTEPMIGYIKGVCSLCHCHDRMCSHDPDTHPYMHWPRILVPDVVDDFGYIVLRQR